MKPQMIPSERGSRLVPGRARGGRRRVLLLAVLGGVAAGTMVRVGWGDTVVARALMGGAWSDPEMWSTNPLVPNNGNGGHDYDVQIWDLWDLEIVTLDMDVVVNGFSISYATLNGSGVLTVKGMLDLAEGGYVGGTSAIHAKGGLEANEGGRLDGRTLNNSGAGTVGLFGLNGAILNNLGTGTLDVFALRQYEISGAMPVLNNAGTIRARPDPEWWGGNPHIEWVLNNAGSVEVKEASLVLYGGGSSSGSFVLGDSRKLTFEGGTHMLGPTSSVTGSGEVRITQGQVIFAGQYDVPSTWIEGGEEQPTATFNSTATTGSLSVRNATLSGSGEIVAKSYLDIGGENTSVSGCVLTNRGMGSYDDYNPIVGKYGAVFNNAAGATLMITNHGSFVWDGGSRPVLNNAGTLVKDNDGRTSTIGWGFNNSGRVEINVGKLELSGGGNSTGEIDVQSGASLVFSGGEHVLGPTSNVHGDGIVRFEGGTVDIGGEYRVLGTTYISGGTVNVNSSLGPIMMVMSAGTVGGNGGVAALGQIVWSGGTFTGKGRLYSPLLLSISRTDAKLLDGWTINSSGKAVWWNGAAVSMQNGAAFNNSGDFEAIGDGVFSYSPVGAEAVFNNSGRFVKSAGIGAIKFDGVRFNNTGSVQVRSGRLELLGPVTQFVAGTLTGGEWDVYDGATLVFSTSGVGVIRNQAKVSLHGAGSVFGHLNALAENQGSLAIMEGRSFSTAASLRNSGTLTIGAGSSLTINGPFINTGIVNSMGTLSVAASGERAAAFAADQPAGSLTISGNITNAGLMNLNGGLGASGLFTNTGTLSISGQQDWKGDPLLVVDGGKLVLASNAGTLDQPVLQIQLLNQGQATFASPQHLKSLGISSGVAALFPGGDNVLRTGQLSLAGPSSLDLADNAMIVQSTSSTREAILSQITEWVGLGRNSPSGLWTGPGITSSAAGADSRHMTALGVALNDKGLGRDTLFSNFAGQPVDIDCTLVRYTWNGDANLDGVVNADDYFRIDSGFITQEEGYYNGDFNYDGVVNADDYFLIDSAFLGQTGPLSASTAGPRAPAVAVPEPSTGAVLCGAIVAALVTGQRGLIRRR